MATTPPANEAFAREVDEELRREAMEGLAKRWGRVVLAVVVMGLLAFGGYQYWQYRQREAGAAQSEALGSAIEALSESNVSMAQARLKPVIASDVAGARVTARMIDAGLILAKGDLAGGAKAFSAIANDPSVPKPYRDLALVRATAAQFDTMTPEQVVAALRDVAVVGNPYFASAGEMVAVSYLAMKKPDLAGKLFADIAKQETAPETIRSRAVQMAGVLGVDAIDDPKAKGSDK